MRILVVVGALVLAYLIGWWSFDWNSPDPVANVQEEKSTAPAARDSLPRREAAPEPGADEARAVALLVENFLSEVQRASQWHDGSKRMRGVGRRLAAVQPPERGLAVLKAIYANVEPAAARLALLREFYDALHPRILEALSLGMGDPDANMSIWVDAALAKFTFGRFDGDAVAFGHWKEKFANLPLKEACVASAQEFAQKLRSGSQADVLRAVDALGAAYLTNESRLREFGVVDALRDGALVESIERILQLPDLSAERRANVLDWLVAVEPTDEEARRLFLPVLQDVERLDAVSAYAVGKALGRSDRAWAAEALVEALKQTQDTTVLGTLASALRKTGRHAAIPELIARMSTVDSPRAQAILSGVLAQWVGITADRSRDAAWWQRWWQEYGKQFGSDE